MHANSFKDLLTRPTLAHSYTHINYKRPQLIKAIKLQCATATEYQVAYVPRLSSSTSELNHAGSSYVSASTLFPITRPGQTWIISQWLEGSISFFWLSKLIKKICLGH